MSGGMKENLVKSKQSYKLKTEQITETVQQVQHGELHQTATRTTVPLDMVNLTALEPPQLTEEEQASLAQMGMLERKKRKKEMLQAHEEARQRELLLQEERRQAAQVAAELKRLKSQNKMTMKDNAAQLGYAQKVEGDKSVFTQRKATLQTMSQISDVLSQVAETSLSEQQQEELKKTLLSAQSMGAGLITYSTKAVKLDDQSFATHLNIVQTMVGMMSQKLKEACATVKQYDASFTESQSANMEAALANIQESCQSAKLRLSDEAYLAKKSGESVTWNQLFERSGLARTINLDGKTTGLTGGQLSTVVTFEDTFFKEDEEIQSLDERELLTDTWKHIEGTEQEVEYIKKAGQTRTVKNKKVNLLGSFHLQLLRDKVANELPESWEQMLDQRQARIAANVTYDKKAVERGVSQNDPAMIEVLKQETVMARLRLHFRNMGVSEEEGMILIRAHKHLVTFDKVIMTKNVAANANIESGEQLTQRNLATTRVAQLLGMSNQVARSEKANIVRNGETKEGFAMERARGMAFTKLPKLQRYNGDEYTGDFQRQLINLQFLDNICGQVDRHVDNIFHEGVQKERGMKFTDIHAIDNDMAFGLEYPITESRGHIRGVLNDLGRCVIPVIDREFYQHLMSITPETLRANLDVHIPPRYLDAAVQRLTAIQSGVNKSIELGTTRVVNREEWGEKTRAALHAQVNQYQGQCSGANYYTRFEQVRQSRVH